MVKTELVVPASKKPISRNKAVIMSGSANPGGILLDSEKSKSTAILDIEVRTRN